MRKEYQLKGVITPPTAIIPSHITYEDFEEVCSFGSAGTGDDWKVYRSPQVISGGNYSLYQATKTTTPTAGDYVYTTLKLPYYVSPINNIELQFSHFTTDNKIEVEIEFFTNYDKPNISFAPLIRLSCETGELYIRDEEKNLKKIGTVGAIGQGWWTLFGMVVNLETQEYISVRIGTMEFVIKGIKFYKSNVFHPTPLVNLTIYSTTANIKARAYFDNLCIMGLLK